MTTATVFPQQAWHAIRHGLFEPTQDYTDSTWVQDVLMPWTAAHQATLTALLQIGQPEMAAVALDTDDLWTLYALSRVAELLIVSSQPPATDPDDEPVDQPYHGTPTSSSSRRSAAPLPQPKCSIRSCTRSSASSRPTTRTLCPN